jgi:endothelin-converting enzyme/putative endopeptidase
MNRRIAVCLALLLAVLLPCASRLVAAEGKQPLAQLPYSPSLDFTSMDQTANPCVDFYQYSCGGWVKKNPIPADQARWSVYGKMTDENQQYLWGLLQEAAAGGAKRTPAQQKIGDYFAACMDEPAVEKLGMKPIEADFAAIKGLGSAAQLAPLVGRLHLETGGSVLFGFGSNQDFGDSSQVIAFAVSGGLGLPDRDYYVKDDARSQETRKEYVAHMARMFGLIGDAPEAAAAAAQTVLKIETGLAKATLTRVEQRDPHRLYHDVKLKDFQAMVPSFRWSEYFTAIGLKNPAHLNVTEPDFYKQLESTLKKESLADLKTYLRWHVLTERAPYMSKAFVQEDFNFFSKYLRGVQEMQPRWKRCVRFIDRDLGEALGQVFVEKNFSPALKTRTLDMVHQIENAMEARIQGLDWMEAVTKTHALEKLHAMRNKIGYPDQWRDYGPVRVERGDFAGDVTRAQAFESKRQLAKIGKPLDRGEWGMTPPEVNAYYNPFMNDINFPAGVLQPPLYDPKMDDAPNYGNTGGTIGHELTHGFDDEGRQFDAQGNLKDWWTEKDGKEFETRAACVVDQYAQYTVVDDIKLNSKLTLGEDVADLGGTIIAYLAWKNATQGQDLKPVDKLTPDQRFFIGYAQWACGDERDESKRLNAVTNPHSPGIYRINGVVVNMPEFAAAFSCSPGQPMVKEKVCRIW